MFLNIIGATMTFHTDEKQHLTFGNGREGCTKKLPVSVDAILHLFQLIWPDWKGIQTHQQPLEAPRTFKEAWVFNDVKPAAGVDINQKHDYPLQFWIVDFGTAPQSEYPVG